MSLIGGVLCGLVGIWIRVIDMECAFQQWLIGGKKHDMVLSKDRTYYGARLSSLRPNTCNMCRPSTK